MTGKAFLTCCERLFEILPNSTTAAYVSHAALPNDLRRSIQGLAENHQWQAVRKSRTSHRTAALVPLHLFLSRNPVQNPNVIYGYARISTDGQSIAAQVSALQAAGAERIFREIASGAKSDRRQLARALNALSDGDVLMVTRLDRLARSTRDLLNTLATITGKRAGFRSLADTWADTTTPHGRLMVTVLGGLAEFERDLIRARTSEGRNRAKERGVKLGRKPRLTTFQKREALVRRENGELLTEIARSYTSVTAQSLDFWRRRRPLQHRTSTRNQSFAQ